MTQSIRHSRLWFGQLLLLAFAVIVESAQAWSVSHGHWVPNRTLPSGILLLIPGYNGSGEAMMDARWKAFAEKHGLVLLAPTFKTTPEELQRGRGYYYPEQGSGAEVERMLEQVGKETGVQTDKILIFGFSVGAHFAHRFALWKPQRVKAFVAYSAAWWSEPTEALREVPALIVCGEADRPRFEPTKEFFERGGGRAALSVPAGWRNCSQARSNGPAPGWVISSLRVSKSPPSKISRSKSESREAERCVLFKKSGSVEAIEQDRIFLRIYSHY